MLYIRVDGNAEIGTGHVMRCLSIASAERRSGGDCVFITADRQMEQTICSNGFSVICLDSVWNNLDLETAAMERLIIEQGIKKLLVDSYFVTQNYLERLNKLTYLIYFDDLNEFVYPCSELINCNIFADKLDYPSRYPQGTVLKLGPKYAPLREEFLGLPQRVVHEEVTAVLVTTGGTDLYNVAGQFLEKALRSAAISEMHYHVVAGKLNKNISHLNELEKKHSNITMHRDISNMAELMRSCDVAVSAGGTTLYELCACGTPAVVFAMADNQVDGIAAFSDGYMLGCGDYRDNPQDCLDRMVAGVIKLAGDFKLRKLLAGKCRELVNRS